LKIITKKIYILHKRGLTDRAIGRKLHIHHRTRDDKPIPEYKQGNGPMSLDVLRMRINSEFRDKFKEHQDSMYALEIKNKKLEYENQTLRNAILIVSPQTPDKDHHQ